MSVSVLPSRNNNNWVENAVVNFVGPIIGDWIKSERDKEINRKNNAAIAQTIQDLMGNNDYPIQPSQNSRLMGGSNNGWQNAFRQSDNNPLAEFDNNTADITPNLAQAAIAPQNRQNIPTAADFLRNLYSNLGTKRFGMVNSEAVQKLAAPYIAALQADLTKQERQALADKYADASDLAAKRDILMGGAIQGHVPYDAPNNAQKWYEFDNPYSIPGSLDAGGEVYPYAFDPRKGSYDFPIQINKSLSPQQKQQGEQWDREYGLKLRQQDFLEEQARFARENPALKTAYGEDGSLYYVNPYTGEAVYAKTPDGEIVKVDPASYSRTYPRNTSSSNNWSQVDRSFVGNRQKAIEDNNKRIRAAKKQLGDLSVSAENKQKLKEEIKQLETQNEKYQAEINEIYKKYQSTNTPQNNSGNSQNNNYIAPPAHNSDFGADSIGGTNNGVVSTKFNAPRKRADGSTYYHAGTDYPAPEGTPIQLIGGLGGFFTVVKVANNPGGYGNYVDLRNQFKDENGLSHTVDIRYAHMKDGSIKVKKGDRIASGFTIGAVGNTGNSRGKNGGYHLHIETRIDGELVDPQDFNNRLVAFIPKKGIRKGKAEAEREAIQKAQDDTFKNANVFFRNSRTGETISQYQFEEMLRQADEGKLRRAGDLFGPPKIRTPEQLLDFIKSEGYDENFIPDNYQYKSNIYYHNPITHSAMTYDDYKKALRAYQHENKNATEEDFIAYLKSIGNERYNNKNDYQVLPPAINNDNERNYMAQSGNEQENNNNVQAQTVQNPEITQSQENNQVSLPHEETGTNFMGEELPGLQMPGELAATTTPMGRNGGAGNSINTTNANVGLTPRLTDEERSNIQTQGDTGSQIASANEEKSVGALNGNNSNRSNNPAEQTNSPVMWRNPETGQTISQYEYNQGLNTSGMENPDYDALLEAHGFKRTDNANSPAPQATDFINGTTPMAIQREVNYLNGDDNYSPYDINYNYGQPYDDNDVYEQGFEYDNERQNNGSYVYPVPQDNNNEQSSPDSYDNKNQEYNILPFILNDRASLPPEETGTNFMGKNLPGLQPYGELAASTTPMGRNGGANANAPRPKDYPNYEELSPPVGQESRYNLRLLPPVGQTYPQNLSAPETQIPTPQQTQQTSNNPNNRNNLPARRNSIIYPKREYRRAGHIRPNTSYENLKPIVDDAAKKHGVDVALIRAIIQKESNWDSNARSSAGAKGLMQLTPITTRAVGVRDAYDVTQNINGGTKYIAQLIKQFNGNITDALMAYNWGPTLLKKGKTPPQKVKNYARDVLAIYNRLKGRKK